MVVLSPWVSWLASSCARGPVWSRLHGHEQVRLVSDLAPVSSTPADYNGKLNTNMPRGVCVEGGGGLEHSLLLLL